MSSPKITAKDISSGAGIMLCGNFEVMAAVSEERLQEMINNGDLPGCFGRNIDPYRTIRGPGVGEKGPL